MRRARVASLPAMSSDSHPLRAGRTTSAPWRSTSAAAASRPRSSTRRASCSPSACAIDTPYPCPPEKLVAARCSTLTERPRRPPPRVRRLPRPRPQRPGAQHPVAVAARRTTATPTRSSRRRGAASTSRRRWPTRSACRSRSPTTPTSRAARSCTGEGFEFVMTLGTGVGTALFLDGRLLPHIEGGHAPFRKGETFEEQLGNVARKDIGNARWGRRVREGDRGVRPVPVLRHDLRRRRQRQAPRPGRPAAHTRGSSATPPGSSAACGCGTSTPDRDATERCSPAFNHLLVRRTLGA